MFRTAPSRLTAFLNPDADPQGAGFQLMQSLIAVGSGGFTGVGLMESKQKLFYLPEAHTDFIYAVICEEFGYIGAILVLALFVVYGWRGLRAAFATSDGFGRLLALGITSLVLSQALINFAVVLGHGADQGDSAAFCKLRRFEPIGDVARDWSAPEYFTAGSGNMSQTFELILVSACRGTIHRVLRFNT